MQDNVPVTTTREGVLYINNKPMAIIEQVDHGQYSFVYVYNLQRNEHNELVKERKLVKLKTADTLQGFTAWQAEIKKAIGRSEKPKKVFQVAPYLYMAPVITGTDMITGKKDQRGFYERDLRGNSSDPEPTGLFVGLNNVRWRGDFSVGKQDLVNAIMKEKGGSDSAYYISL